MTAVATDWQPISSAPEGVVLRTKIDDEKGSRNEQRLIRRGRLWYFSDESMYVYYTPTHWAIDSDKASAS